MAAFDKNRWLEESSRRTGIAPDLLEKAFRDELEGKWEIDHPLEIPDRMSITYRYSYGRQSRFFRELRDNARLMGAKCPQCGVVYCPPRSDCSNCYVETEWVPLSGEGVIEGCTTVYYGTSDHIGKVPFVCAFVKLDGADFFIWQFIDADDITKVKPGARVKAAFKEHRSGLVTDFIFKLAE
jgi:uncharacterized OB-fold protein